MLKYTVFIVQVYQTSQYVVPCGGIFLGKWRSAFAGSSDGKMNVQLACALNTRYFSRVSNQQMKNEFVVIEKETETSVIMYIPSI
jgi:hypothetical protein